MNNLKKLKLFKIMKESNNKLGKKANSIIIVIIINVNYLKLYVNRT